MQGFKQFIEWNNIEPSTDDEALIRIPNDGRLQNMYKQLRKQQDVKSAWNSVMQHQWKVKQATNRIQPHSPWAPEGKNDGDDAQ